MRGEEPGRKGEHATATREEVRADRLQHGEAGEQVRLGGHRTEVRAHDRRPQDVVNAVVRHGRRFEQGLRQGHR